MKVNFIIPWNNKEIQYKYSKGSETPAPSSIAGQIQLFFDACRENPNEREKKRNYTTQVPISSFFDGQGKNREGEMDREGQKDVSLLGNLAVCCGDVASGIMDVAPHHVVGEV